MPKALRTQLAIMAVLIFLFATLTARTTSWPLLVIGSTLLGALLGRWRRASAPGVYWLANRRLLNMSAKAMIRRATWYYYIVNSLLVFALVGCVSLLATGLYLLWQAGSAVDFGAWTAAFIVIGALVAFVALGCGYILSEALLIQWDHRVEVIAAAARNIRRAAAAARRHL